MMHNAYAWLLIHTNYTADALKFLSNTELNALYVGEYAALKADFEAGLISEDPDRMSV